MQNLFQHLSGMVIPKQVRGKNEKGYFKNTSVLP